MQIKRPICSIIVWLLLGIACMNCHFFDGSYIHEKKEEQKEEYVIFTGTVKSKEYKLSFGKEQLVVLLETEHTEQAHEKYTRQQLLCYMQEASHEPYIGQRIMVRGKPEVFPSATNPGEFDSYKYYQILKISYKLSNVVILSESKTFSVLKENLYRVKKRLSFLIDNSFHEREAGIIKAMLLGDKSSLNEEVKKLYELSGMIHILAISGVHISIIGMGVYKLLHKCMLPKALRIPMVIILMILYGMMTGGAVSLVRAIFMFGMRLLAELAGRTYDMVTALAFIGIIILWQQPFYMAHSGFMLSFSSVMGLLYVLPWIKEITDMCVMKGNIVIEGVRKGILAGISIAIATLPIQLHFYYVYPLTSLLTNLIVVPLVGIVLADGILTVFLCFVFMCVTRVSCGAAIGKMEQVIAVIRKPSEWILFIYEEIGKISSRIDAGIWVIGKPELWQVIIYYLIVAGMILYQRGCFPGQKKKEKIPQFIQIVLVLTAVCFLCKNPREGLQVHFLDVGQGDCIVLINENGNAYMVDGGSTSKSDVGANQIIPFLKYMGVKNLEAVFITHPDMDHISGIEEMLQTDICRIKIKRLILPDVAQNLKDTELIGLRELAAESDAAVYYMHQGELLRDGNLKIMSLNPAEKESAQDMNALSQVLYVAYKDFSMLLTGDVTGEKEQQLCEGYEILQKQGAISDERITVLKVAHHGSRYSTTEQLLKQMSPRYAIISAGKKNVYNHPHTETMERLERFGSSILKTMDYGAITIQVKGKKVLLKGYRKQP